MVKTAAIVKVPVRGRLLVARTVIVGPLPGHEGVLQNVRDTTAPAQRPVRHRRKPAVITSFGGLEIVTIAAAEAEDPRAAMVSAIRSVVTRHSSFYVGLSSS